MHSQDDDYNPTAKLDSLTKMKIWNGTLLKCSYSALEAPLDRPLCQGHLSDIVIKAQNIIKPVLQLIINSSLDLSPLFRCLESEKKWPRLLPQLLRYRDFYPKSLLTFNRQTLPFQFQHPQ